MSIFGKTKPKITAERKLSSKGNIKSGIVFTVKGGLDRLIDRRAVSEDEYDFSQQTMLDGTVIAQNIVPCCPTCASLIAAGYGIENADCPELRKVCDRINEDFIDIEHSFEIMKPLLGLLKDGTYLIADAECIPTDGEGRFFWDIDPEMKEYNAASSMYYVFEEEGCSFYNYESVDPIFLYPTQSASLYNKERTEYYREHNRDNENAPRAIALNNNYGISLLLDGHHKAAAAALEGQRVKCLLIIPSFDQFFRRKDEDWKFARQVFTEDIFIEAKDFTDKQIKELKEKFLARRSAQKIKPEAELCEPKLILREWEKEFAENASRYPTVRELSLMKIFGGVESFGKKTVILNKALDSGETIVSLLSRDALGFEENEDIYEISKGILGLKMMFLKAFTDKDPALKKAAFAVIREEYDYDLVSTALKYLLLFREDSEVEAVCIDIISDGEKYDRYGHIAIDHWEDEI